MLARTTFAAAILLASYCAAQELTADNYDQLVPQGKEIDAIYGDYALTNSTATAVVAQPASTRNANMTVRSVGGALIDLTISEHQSDQLSCFYPGRRKFPFTEWHNDGNVVQVISQGTEKRPRCEVTYRFSESSSMLTIRSEWKNTTERDWTLALEDDIRADGGKEDMVKTPNGTHDLFWIHDIYWQQAYGVLAPGYRIRCNSNSRESVLTYEREKENPVVLKPGETFELVRHVFVGRNLPEVKAAAVQNNTTLHTTQLLVSNAVGNAVPRARVTLKTGGDSYGTAVTDENGIVTLPLPAGNYEISATVAGLNILPDAVTCRVPNDRTMTEVQSTVYRPGVVSAKIIDAQGQAVPAKVEFTGAGDTATPDWGPDTAEHFVRNLAYTEDGEFEIPLQSGNYDIIVSRGPEYDAVYTRVEVTPSQTSNLRALLRRVVDSPGWISSDFHSHSSPSGDNTGSQKGRVLNLAAENIEFAPCTEHNRVSTYNHHIEQLNLKPYLATVSGMELTGSPLPLNHQNVFPLRYKPRTQDGGGPVTDRSPETQVERIALWDNRSRKLIQQNHPDLGWLFYDRDGDGEPDEGFARSFPFMDVMEIHPIDRILNVTRYDERDGRAFNNNRMLNWLQLLNQGFRIYGVVNTDAHYNYHGSGWLRNWIQSSSDNPADIDPEEMVAASEEGRLIMSNGPYLETTVTSDSGSPVVSGQDLVTKSGEVTVHVRVQCANWLNIDTVFLLINGRTQDELRFTRKDHPDMFQDGVVKFDEKLSVKLRRDAHLIVVTGHQTELLGDVMGPDGGRQHPAALTNPIFIDVDGDGFKANQDTLDHPLPVRFGKEKG